MLRGASAEAYDDLVSTIGSGLNQADTAELGDQLFAVAQTLRADASVRRVVTDSAVEAAAKQGLVRDLFGSRIGEAALAVLVRAAEQRWTSSTDLPKALESLSEVAAVRSVGAKSQQLADELFELGRHITTIPELRDALSNPGRTEADRAGLAETLFGGQVLPATLTLVKQALAGTYGTVGAALEVYRDVAAMVREEGFATVRVVRPLTEAERERLRSALSRQYGREIHLNEIIDPDVVGGVRVEIAHDIIDGTVVNRLDEARRRLVG